MEASVRIIESVFDVGLIGADKENAQFATTIRLEGLTTDNRPIRIKLELSETQQTLGQLESFLENKTRIRVTTGQYPPGEYGNKYIGTIQFIHPTIESGRIYMEIKLPNTMLIPLLHLASQEIHFESHEHGVTQRNEDNYDALVYSTSWRASKA